MLELHLQICRRCNSSIKIYIKTLPLYNLNIGRIVQLKILSGKDGLTVYWSYI